MFEYIQEENYVETPDYSYVIKELIMDENDFITVHCGPDIEEVKGRLFPHFDCYEVNLE
jgi:hypothetical protein